MFTRDLAGGLLSVCIGSAYLYFTFSLRSSSLSDSVGPAGFPKLLGILMVLLGVVLCIQATYQSLRQPGSINADWQGQARVLLRATGMFALGVLYLLIVKYLGYLFSIMLLIFLVALYQGVRPGWRLFIISVSGAIILWLIFSQLLGVSLPSGIFIPGS